MSRNQPTGKLAEHLGQWPYFLIAIPVLYLIHLVNDFYPILTTHDLWWPANALYIGIPVLLFILVTWVRPSLLKYVVLILYAEFLFFFFAPLFDLINRMLPPLARYKYLLPLFVTGALWLFLYWRKRMAHPPRFFLYLNILFGIFLLIEVVQLAALGITDGNARSWFAENPANRIQPTTPCDTCQQPDIYFIIFDGYSGDRALQECWGYNNRPLRNSLQQLGFFYATRSTSNYNSTAYSVSSILNMNYPYALSNKKLNTLNFCKAARTIGHNTVCHFLQQQQYTLINHSIFNLPGTKSNIDAGVFNRRTIMQQQTLAGRLIFDIGWNFGWHTKTIADDSSYRKFIRELKKPYERLLQTSATANQGPVFVYAHFMIPHSPYFFDSTGNLTAPAVWKTPDSTNQFYLGQLKYTNSIITDLATRLRKEGTRPRVIIIQSDHGLRSFEGLPKTCNEFDNLNAIYYPDGDYRGLSDTQSSVNTFPRIFNKYFRTTLPILKDSTVTLIH